MNGKQRFILIFALVAVVVVGGTYFIFFSPSGGVQISEVSANDGDSEDQPSGNTKGSKKSASTPAGQLAELQKKMTGKQPKRPYIVIDTHANKITLRTKDSILLIADCSTGSGGELTDSATGRKWIFDTPRGVFKISSKIKEPWWRKPDWAFIEEGEAVPKNDQERLDPRVMGDFAMGFGDGYFIHGTIYERLLGVGVTHGCVRVGSVELGELYKQVPMGTQVYIF